MEEDEEQQVFSIEINDPYIPLDSQDSEYLRGIEIGILLHSCIFNFGSHMKVHASNIEQILRLAECFNYSFYAEDSEDEDMLILTMVPGPCGCGGEDCENNIEED